MKNSFDKFFQYGLPLLTAVPSLWLVVMETPSPDHQRLDPTFLLGLLGLILSVSAVFARLLQMEKRSLPQRSRELWLDLLKAFSAPLIVLIHTIGGAYRSVTLGSRSWIGYLVLNVIPRCAVPIFIMVSGILLIGHETSEEKVKRYFRKALLLLVVWNAFYILLNSALKGSYDDLLKQLVSIPVKRGPSGHLWYSYLLLWIYLFTPILNKLYQALTARQRCYFVAITVAVPGILDLYNRLLGLGGPANLPSFFTYMTLTYMGMMFLGRMVYESSMDRCKQAKIGAILCAGGFFATLLISYFYCIKHQTATDQFLPETQFFVLCYSVGILMMAAAGRNRIERIPERGKRAIEFLSKRSLGIYFAHVTAIWLLSAIHIGSSTYMVKDGAPIAVLFCLIYYVMTVIGVDFMSRIPGLRKLVM